MDCVSFRVVIVTAPVGLCISDGLCDVLIHGYISNIQIIHTCKITKYSSAH